VCRRADKLSLTVTLPITDPLFTVKRVLLQQHSLSTQQQFQLARDGVRRPPRRTCRPLGPAGSAAPAAHPACAGCGAAVASGTAALSRPTGDQLVSRLCSWCCCAFLIARLRA